MKPPTDASALSQVACYLRSSKDRHDLSIDAQRQALYRYAHDQGLSVAVEFVDVVESGKDDDRPGFQQMLAAIKNPHRGWSTILALDTSRIARRRHIALIFEHECEKAGITVRYKSVPDTDPVTGMLLRSVLQAMDEWHSLTSKAKGLAGMAETVRQGYRAGGRAPRGYRLLHQPTGSLRDGQPVIRSRLIPDDDEAPAVTVYLQTRALGKPRGIASQLSGITGSLNDLEWNALTYAGHTVWNMASERHPSGYVGGQKRRPREDWKITRNTHPALISDEEAEAILARLATGQGRRNRSTDRVYLLSGLLESPDGTPYIGESTRDQANYRLGKGRRIAVRLIETAVLDQVFADLASPDTAKQIAERMRAQGTPSGKPRDLGALKKRLATLDQKIYRLVERIADDIDAAPAYQRAIVTMEAERAVVLRELETAEQEQQQAQIIALWTPADVSRLLTTLRETLETDLAEERVRQVREVLNALIERVVYDLDQRQFVIHYRLNTGLNVASPRGTNVKPVCWTQVGRVVARRAA